ncbi:MAG: TA system VapC family ribonuclease toxin [Verrucomicrobiota bacterium]
MSVWIALAFSSHPHHDVARAVFESLDSTRPAAFCRATQHSFLRLVSTPAVQRIYGSSPITNEDAWEQWAELIALPQVVWLDEPAGVEALWQQYARRRTPAPKVWMDAYLAAFAKGHGISLLTLDEDLARYKGVRVEYLLDRPSAGSD